METSQEETDISVSSNDEKINLAKNESEPVFKVPSFSKISSNKDKKAKKNLLSPSEKNSLSEKIVGEISAESNNNSNPRDPGSTDELSDEKRTLISFRPKSNVLPSQVYKPHQPTASEYMEHYSKRENVTNDNNDKSEGAMKTADSKEFTKEQDSKIMKSKSEGSKLPPQKLKYEKPDWSTPCEEDEENIYSLEVLKGGSIVDRINLATKEYFIIGRMAECDIVLEHPSISRHHAILQFGNPGESDDVEFQKDGSSGFYLFDLASTHGTFLNKARVPSEKYYRMKVGHMIKFGGSSRIYILQGPPEDEEEESKESATELREKARKIREKEELAKMMLGDDSDDDDEVDDATSRRQDVQDTGVTWGMLEDAVAESDEEEKEEEQLPVLQERKDPFYVKDPHKALKNFYQKEGLEVEFDSTERRPGQWNVRLELPIDSASGRPIVAEASLTGKKKDAMNNCALEACRLLDKHGMFKQSEHHRRKVKEWEKEDFYDSDEDQYWDRTGDLDKKRQQRKMRVGVKKKSAAAENAETYESLTKKINILEKEITEIERQLDNDRKVTTTSAESSDPLEDFMVQVKSGRTLDSLTRSKLKLRLFEVRKESARLTKLAEIARPASLPPLQSSSTKSMSFIGRMKGKKKGLLMPNKPILTTEVSFNMKDVPDVEEVDEEEPVSTEAKKTDTRGEHGSSITSSVDTEQPTNQMTPLNKPSLPSPENMISMESEESSSNKIFTAEQDPGHPTGSQEVKTTNGKPQPQESTPRRKRTFGPTLPPELKEELLGGSRAQDVKDEGGRKSRRKKKKTNEPQSTTSGAVCSNDPDYSDWMPPTGQTGDGTTSLNAKFGY
ncbi:unnamed protein product [Clavelina lepadiformis]|uniref:FHA domain-containing protein n=1 Tax=Clavelina lepadiformis TaxID=159417 RepID=A0ABP0GNA0_CLALP